jgi:hypothetical protein
MSAGMTDHARMTDTCHCGGGDTCHCDHEQDHHVGTPVVVTINPEARVSVALSRSLLPAPSSADSVTLQVAVLNDAFITLPLEAVLLDPVHAGVTLEFPRAALTGQPREHRTLTLRMERQGPVDITVGFRLEDERADLGGRDRFHFLVDRGSATHGD